MFYENNFEGRFAAASSTMLIDHKPAVNAASKIVQEIAHLIVGPKQVYIIAVDGGSGSGKSTIAAAAAKLLGAALVPGDDFFAAHVTTEGWAQRTPEEKAAD